MSLIQIAIVSTTVNEIRDGPAFIRDGPAFIRDGPTFIRDGPAFTVSKSPNCSTWVGPHKWQNDRHLSAPSSQQKQDLELTVAQIVSSLLQNSALN